MGNFLKKTKMFSVDFFSKSILYEDNHLLVLNKPSGIATMGTYAGEDSLFTIAQQYIRIKYNKQGSVYLGVVSRLDLPVSGVVVFAKTSKAASRLNEQFRDHSVQKVYLALVKGKIQPDSAMLTDMICEDKLRRNLWISHDTNNKLQQITVKEACLQYHVLKRLSKSTLVEILLLTGRKHQIRLQLAHKGNPIIGDGKYGASPLDHQGICLLSYKLTLTHPTTKKTMIFTAPLPNWAYFK